MGILRELFGSSREEIWRRLSAEIGADYVAGGFWTGDKVLVHHGQWTITLDSPSESSGETSSTCTRMRAPYVNKDGFRFTIYRKGFFSDLGKLLGMQDVDVGYPDFDEAFIIKGEDESKLRALFADGRIRALLQAQPSVYLTVKDDDGWFGARFPDGVDELYLLVGGGSKDMDRLKSLYDLFAEILHQLCHIGSAYEDDPNIVL